MFTRKRHKKTYKSRKSKLFELNPREAFNALSIDNIRRTKQEQSYLGCSNKFLSPSKQNISVQGRNCNKKDYSQHILEDSQESVKTALTSPEFPIRLKRNSVDAFDKLLMGSPVNGPEIIAVNKSDLDPSIIAKINISSGSSATLDSPMVQIDSSSESDYQANGGDKKFVKRVKTRKKLMKPVFQKRNNKNDSTVFNHLLEVQNIKSKNNTKSDNSGISSLLQNSKVREIFQDASNYGTPKNKKNSSAVTMNSSAVKNDTTMNSSQDKKYVICNLCKSGPAHTPYTSTPFKSNAHRLKLIENCSPISLTDSDNISIESVKAPSIKGDVSLNTGKPADINFTSKNNYSKACCGSKSNRETIDNDIRPQMKSESKIEIDYKQNNSNSHNPHAITKTFHSKETCVDLCSLSTNKSKPAIEISPNLCQEEKLSNLRMIGNKTHEEQHSVGITTQVLVNMPINRVEKDTSCSEDAGCYVDGSRSPVGNINLKSKYNSTEFIRQTVNNERGSKGESKDETELKLNADNSKDETDNDRADVSCDVMIKHNLSENSCVNSETLAQLLETDTDTNSGMTDHTLNDEPYFIGFTSQQFPVGPLSRTETSSPDMFDSINNILQYNNTNEFSPLERSISNTSTNKNTTRNKSFINSKPDINESLASECNSQFRVLSAGLGNDIDAFKVIESVAVFKDVQSECEDSMNESDEKCDSRIVLLKSQIANADFDVKENIKPAVVPFIPENNAILNIDNTNTEDCDNKSSTDSIRSEKDEHSIIDLVNNKKTDEEEHFNSDDSSLVCNLKSSNNSPSRFVTRRKSNKRKTNAESQDSSDYDIYITFDSTKTEFYSDTDSSNRGENLDESVNQNISCSESQLIPQILKPGDNSNNVEDDTEAGAHCQVTLIDESDESKDVNMTVRRRSSICLRTRRIVCGNSRHAVKTPKKKEVYRSAKKEESYSYAKKKSLVANEVHDNLRVENSDGDNFVFAAPKPVSNNVLMSNAIKDPFPNNFNNELDNTTVCGRQSFVLQPGKRWERSLSIMRRATLLNNTIMWVDSFIDKESSPSKGRKCRESIANVLMLQNTRAPNFDAKRTSFKPRSRSRRSTITIIEEPQLDVRHTLHHKDSPVLIANSTGFLSDTCNDTLINLSRLSISTSNEINSALTKSKLVDGTVHVRPTARDIVLRRCNQDFPLPFDECFPEVALKHCRKIGEGVYGEVFMYRPLPNEDGLHAAPRVMKVIPVEGDLVVNGEHQKKFDEILSEIVIAMELSTLRSPKCSSFNNKRDTLVDIGNVANLKKNCPLLLENCTDTFTRVECVRCVQGAYPKRLLDLWDLFDETKGSENDSPVCFSDEQLYIVLELENGGEDLEAFVFNNAEQACAIFDQVALSLAIAEETYQFEHRDLHWGNILVSATDKKFGEYTLNGTVYSVPLNGVKATIIDYTLSRMTLPAAGVSSVPTTIFNDLSTDDELFGAVGDYQFEIYRLMKKKNENCWLNFEPYSNVLWLHYTLDKMITALRYKRINTNVHKHSIGKLQQLKDSILQHGSAAEFVNFNYEKFIE